MSTDPGERFQVEEYEGRRTLMSDGVILSVDPAAGDPPFGYWTAMLPERAPRTALLLGVGAGTLAHLLVRRFPAVQITGVDNDPELIAFARRHFDLELPNLTVVIEDAFQYVAACRDRFDYVAVDLFCGHEFQRKSLSRPFLRQLKAVATPQGEIAVNLFHDGRSGTYVSRVARILRITRLDRLVHNVVAHCAPD
jgi:spermidine synthase